MYNYACCFENGTGVKKDLPLAQQWYERAAKEGLPDAMYELGVWYEDGRCGPERCRPGPGLVQKSRRGRA